jgi:alpha-glucosidase
VATARDRLSTGSAADFTEAQTELEAALDRDPASLEALALLAEARALPFYVFGQGRYEEVDAAVVAASQAFKLAQGSDFIARVPTSWDETRVLTGEIGQYIVTARRKGETWYVGAMTDERARKLAVPLDFLAPGTAYTAELYEDAADPNALRQRTATLRAGGRLTLDLAGSGGAVAVIEPAAR